MQYKQYKIPEWKYIIFFFFFIITSIYMYISQKENSIIKSE